MGNVIMKGKDTVSAQLAECFVTIEGNRYNFMQAINWTIVNKKDTIFKYIFWERIDYLPIPECCFHFIRCQIA